MDPVDYFPSDAWFGWMGPSVKNFFGTYDRTEIAEKYVFRPFEFIHSSWGPAELWKWRPRKGGRTITCWVTGEEVPVWCC